MSNKRVNTAKWLKKYERWQINVQKDGKRKTFTCKTPGRKGQRICNKKADEWLQQDNNENIKTFKDLCGSFLEYKENNVSPETLITYSGIINKHLSSLNYKKVYKLQLNDFQTVLNKLHVAGYKYGYIKNVRALIVQILKHGRFMGVTSLTAEFLTVPAKAVKGSDKKALELKHVNTLLTSADVLYYGNVIQDPFINAYRFLLLTGLRASELIALKWSDIVIDINGFYVLNVQRNATKLKNINSGKTENAKRIIVLNEIALNVLTTQKELLKKDHIKSVFVFPDKLGNMLLYDTLKNRFKAFASYHAFNINTLHELRHTFITLNNDIDISELKSIVGHGENTDTLKIYSHMTKEQQQKTAEEIGAKFNAILNAF